MIRIGKEGLHLSKIAKVRDVAILHSLYGAPFPNTCNYCGEKNNKNYCVYCGYPQDTEFIKPGENKMYLIIFDQKTLSKSDDPAGLISKLTSAGHKTIVTNQSSKKVLEEISKPKNSSLEGIIEVNMGLNEKPRGWRDSITSKIEFFRFNNIYLFEDFVEDSL